MKITGLHNKKSLERLLKEINLTLDRTGEVCQTVELTRSHAKVIQQGISHSNDYNVVATRRNRKDFEHTAKQEMIMKCKFYSYIHERGSRPAYDKVRNSCHKKGHFSKCCVNFKRQDIKQITMDKSKFYDSEHEHLLIGAVTSDENLNFEESDNEWSIDFDINGTLINFKIASGAQVNILPLNEYYRLQNLPKLHSISIKLSAYNCSYIPLKGSCIARIKHNLSTIPVSFLVTNTSSTPIIGLSTSPKLNLTKRVMQVNSPLPYYLKELRNYFSDIGCLSGKNHTVMDTNQSPTVNPPKPNTICPM